MFYSRGWVQKGLPGRRSGCWQWLHCGFAAGRPACCSCSAGEGTVGHTPVGASPSFSGEMTGNNKEIKVRGWELGSTCSFIAIHGMHLSLPTKTQSPLQSTEELDAFAYLFLLILCILQCLQQSKIHEHERKYWHSRILHLLDAEPLWNSAVHLTAATASWFWMCLWQIWLFQLHNLECLASSTVSPIYGKPPAQVSASGWDKGILLTVSLCTFTMEKWLCHRNGLSWWCNVSLLMHPTDTADKSKSTGSLRLKENTVSSMSCWILGPSRIDF